MPARRCAIHGINYPNDSTYNKCPLCGEHTTQRWHEDPDDDWQGKVERMRERQRLAEEAEANVHSFAEPLPIYEEHGQFWVNQGDLIRAGLRKNNTASFWLFIANGHYWEAQAWDDPNRRWWIQEVMPVEENDGPADA